MTTGLLALTLIFFPQHAAQAEEVRASARKAEAAYERAARRFAPLVGWGRGSSDCDEIVGRFCIRFDAEGVKTVPPQEPARIIDARRAAIDTLRRAFTLLPGDPAVAGPLVRLLIEDERAAEAVPAALTFAGMTSDSVSGPLVEGLALHAAGEDSAAGAAFDRALARMDPERASRVTNLEWLLSPHERSRYRRLEGEARRIYEETVWRLADPIYLTSFNERWAEHVARYSYARLLERAPLVRDMSRWGRDLEQLAIRYGVAHRRGRQNGVRLDETTIVEYYEPDQLSYVIPDYLTRGMPPQPPPGMRWPLAEERARSGYAPAGIRSMDELPHQLTRVPVPDGWIVRVDGDFGLDTLARVPPEPLPGDTARPPAPDPVAVAAGLFLLDLDGAAALVGDVRGDVPLRGDSARVSFELPLAPGTYAYSLEALEPATRTARRARYRLEIEDENGLRVSDVVVAQPFEGGVPASYRDSRLVPLTDLVVTTASRIGIYAQAVDDAPGPHRIEVAIRRGDRGSLPARIVSWLGQTLGLTDEPTPARVAWSAQHTEGPLIVAIDLGLADVTRGLHVIEVTVVNTRTGESGSGQRIVRIEEEEVSG